MLANWLIVLSLWLEIVGCDENSIEIYSWFIL